MALHAWVVWPLQGISLALTVYVIVGALIGTERAALNPAPAGLYVAFWVGLSFFTAVFGNLWHWSTRGRWRGGFLSR